jgi:hypothetical protein
MGKNFRPHRRVRSLDGDGRAGKPNLIWMKPGDVCEIEVERVRNHFGGAQSRSDQP